MGHHITAAGLHLLSGRWGQLCVNEIGGNVASWRPGGRERLYLAGDAVIGTADMWHGGIPACAPWFGGGRGDWPVPFGHGLVSRVRWQMREASVDDEGARILLCTDAEATRGLPGADRYPDDLTYELEVVADATSLTVALSLGSPSREVAVELALHPYLLTDVKNASVAGLAGVEYDDFADGTHAVETGEVALGGYLDRVYAGAPPTTLSDGVDVVLLEADGANSIIVWNPGPVNTQVPGDEWARFVCVEYGNVKGGAITIPAGGSHRLRLRLATA